MSDRIFGAIGLSLAAFFVWGAARIELSFISDPVGPRSFPYIISAILALASAVVIWRPGPEPAWPGVAKLAEIAVATGVMVAYALALPEIGFLIATALATTILTWRLGTAPLNAVGVGVATSVGIYTVFHLILGLSLAKGPLGI